MSGGFLLISPKLRDQLLGVCGDFANQVDKYSPYSYVVLGLALVGGLALTLNSSPRPR